MDVFVETILSMPTVLFTAPLALILVYWCTVIVGAVDLELFDSLTGLDALEGVDGALDGVDGAFEGVDGALDGVDGALEGADGALESVDGADAAVEVSDGVGGFGLWHGLASALRLGEIPVTISVSLWVFFGWVTSYVGIRVAVALGVLSLAAELGVLAAATLTGLGASNVLTAPLLPVFRTTQARSRAHLIGETVEVRTGRVDAAFGQGSIVLRGDELLVPIRCDRGAEHLRRGERALVVHYDEKREAFVVEPLISLPGPDGRERSTSSSPEV